MEITFRDEYLTRADMWRLAIATLADKPVYKGQKIRFLGTIKALVKTIFVGGVKVESAYFGAGTKPIFRSESARYVLFIQMSKEMWDFDADGSGEIMFSKVINGFLPDLFKRWQKIGVKHLISIVLFTRLEYEKNLPSNFGQANASDLNMQNIRDEQFYQDFYRVVVSDISGGHWVNILSQLKTEFKTFLRDVSIRQSQNGQFSSLRTSLAAASTDLPHHVICGRPSTAIRGNILEAINLASSQFSCDHIDRDLVRTGVSITIISPGTGLFEVDYQLLVKTTENLVENGVGIDLVCLSRMPLHSVPLFKYWHSPSHLQDPQNPWEHGKELGPNKVSLDGFANSLNQDSISCQSLPDSDTMSQHNTNRRSNAEHWSYGIPHWIDVSFWTSSSNEDQTQAAILGKLTKKNTVKQSQRKAFIPRIRMYELQMMGVTENAMSDISLPFLSQYPVAASNDRQPDIKPTGSQSKAKSLNNQGRSKNGSTSTRTAIETMAKTSVTSTKFITSDDYLHPHHWMDEYDDTIFHTPEQRRTAERKARKAQLQNRASGNRWHRDLGHSIRSSRIESFGSSSGTKFGSEEKTLLDQVMKGEISSPVRSQKRGSFASTISSSNVSLMKPAKLPRKISFGPRGFSSGTLKSTASTEVSAEHAKSTSPLSRSHKPRSSTRVRGGGPSGSGSDSRTRHLASGKSVEYNPNLQNAMNILDVSSQQSTRPIPIRNLTALRVPEDQSSELRMSRARDDPDITITQQNPDSYEQSASSSRLPTLIDSYEFPVTLSPISSMAPWLTILNPSNPHKTDTTMASRLGRWQHIYPRHLRASKIKWKSLCSPAAIPLTTEDFPSSDQIAMEYQESQYRVTPLGDNDLPEQPRNQDWLLREMMAFRFSHGFQVVVGSRLSQSMNLATNQVLDLFQTCHSSSSGCTIIMSRGSVIHQLSHTDTGCVNVKCLTRHAMFSSNTPENTANIYKPAIRTRHADEYDFREMNLFTKHKETNWETIDNLVSGNEKSRHEPYAENLHSWRARFVLIPVDSPSSGRRPLHPVNEDDEEEIRLEGIRKLTQLWQQFRYIPVNERRFQASARVRKDTNPLDIMYQTRNPSTIIAAELDSIGEFESTGRPVQLLPESELYQRSNLNLISLAQVIQSEKGVRMQDRRWHWRLHYNCFIGLELTTWMLQNFRDVETREEAVDLGNELMNSGLFQHVEQRHNFRDGNFFYQIASDYRTPRPESNRNWFGSRKVDKSVPSTPISEGKIEGSPRLPRSRASSTGENNSDSEPSTPIGNKQRLGVALSKSLLYNVDRRKRSHRPEVITLHYDRLHNPDNCYHIRIDWMNVTAKFIEDAIVNWATIADRFGLRLVEVPLGEAVAITEMHPFRAPYLVQLIQSPPGKQPRTYIDATSFSTQDRAEKHFYQKAILKKFHFVLDFEAANDFPSDVNVTYSWGKPNYRYSQYIHRSGVLIAQITDEGDFFLLANRLYNNRSAKNEDGDRLDGTEVQGGSTRFSPVRNGDRCSPRSSPYSSPLVQAVQDGPGSKSGFARSGQTTAFVSPEQIKSEFEAFCHDRTALEQFYNSVLSKASPSGPNTPFMEGSIPTLGLPPSIALPEGASAIGSDSHFTSTSENRTHEKNRM